MKKTRFISCLLLLCLLLPVAVSAVGNISVHSVPTAATIMLDGVNTGLTTNAMVENVPSGSHTILLQMSGYQDYSQLVTVINNQTSTVSFTLVTSTPAPTITSISPYSGYNTSVVSITYLAGSGFATSGTPGIVLMKSGLPNITATSVSVVSASQITCSFDITGKQAGLWSLVVTNPDGQSATLTNGFEIKNPGTAVTLSSLTPNSGVVNTTVTITDLSGSGFLNTATILLRKNYENDLPGTAVNVVSGSKITGSFNLNGRKPGSYDVCVLNDGTTPTCGLAFTIQSAASTANGIINIKSTPTPSKVFVNTVYQGYTPMILENITPGTYAIVLRLAGYNDYSENVKVTAGNTAYVTASLVLSPDATTATTTAPITTVATVKTTAKSTVKVPTPWPTATPAPASPVSPFVILGAAGIGLIGLRKW